MNHCTSRPQFDILANEWLPKVTKRYPILIKPNL
jgi:hypothetical protein